MPPHIHIPSIRDQADIGEGKMDNALKFDKIAAATARPVQPGAGRPGRHARNASIDRRKAREVPEAGRADQEDRRAQGPTRSR